MYRVDRSFLREFKENFPEKLIGIGNDCEFNDDQIISINQIAEQLWLSYNISETIAIERAIKIILGEINEL